MECECGCGWAGYDDVTQFLVEEALYERLDHVEREIRRRAGVTTEFEDTGPGVGGVSPGEAKAAEHAMRMAALGAS